MADTYSWLRLEAECSVFKPAETSQVGRAQSVRLLLELVQRRTLMLGQCCLTRQSYKFCWRFF